MFKLPGNHLYNGSVLTIKGSVTESDIFEDIFQNTDEKIRVDFSDLTEINSCGIRNFISAIKTTKKPIEYLNCPWFLLEHLVLIPELTKNGLVNIKSIEVSYLCNKCGNESRSIYFKKESVKQLKEELPHSIPCECGSRMNLDFPIDMLSNLLNKSRPKEWSTGTIVTELSLSSFINQHKTIFDFHITPAAIIDSLSYVHYANRAFKTLLNCRITHHGRTKKLSELCTIGEAGYGFDPAEFCIENKKAFNYRELPAYTAQGDSLTLNFHIQPVILDKNNKLMGFLICIQDMTMEEILHNNYKTRLSITQKARLESNYCSDIKEISERQKEEDQFKFKHTDLGIELYGRIDEKADLIAAFSTKSHHIVVNWKHVKGFNSCGIRNYIDVINQFNPILEHINIPPVVFNNMLSIHEINTHGKIHTFYAEYNCSKCRAEKNLLIAVDFDGQIQQDYPLELACKCGNEMDCELDSKEDVQDILIDIYNSSYSRLSSAGHKIQLNVANNNSLQSIIEKEGILFIEMMNVMNSAALLTDEKGKIIYTNPALKIITGDIHAPLGLYCYDIIRSEHCHNEHCVLTQAKHKMCSVVHTGVSCKPGKKNEPGFFKAGAVPVFNNKQIIGTLLTYSDISQDINVRKEFLDKLSQFRMVNQELETQKILLNESKNNLENQVHQRTKELIESNKNLKQFDKLKTQFFFNISHEFRTPLTLILGPLETILSDLDVNLDNKLKEHLYIMLRNARRLLRLVNQLLDLSKLQSNKVALHYKEYNILSFINETLTSFKPFADKKNIHLIFEEKCSINKIFYDLDKMEKVFYNLISNACKFTPNNGTIKVLVEDHNSSYIKITISDTGPGIPDKAKNLIFERFQQVDGSHSREYDGTGIGLALVKELIDLHEGRIEVNSIQGKGSKFHVYLKTGNEHVPEQLLNIAKETLEDYKKTNVAKLEMAGISQVINPENSENDIQKRKSSNDLILVIEDNPDMRAYICNFLSDNYYIKSACDGKEGIEKAKQINPSLIISDVMMPKMNGYEVCRYLKENNKTCHIPIILLTAKASKDMIIEGLKCGADDYLTKPFNASELRVRINNLLTMNKQTYELKEAYHQLEEAYSELETAKDRLVKAEKLGSLGILSAGLSHEINNPNNFIYSSSQQITDELKQLESIIHIFAEKSEEPTLKESIEIIHLIKDYIKSIETGSFRINEIVKGLKHFSFMKEATKSYTDLNKLIKQTISEMKFMIPDTVSVQFDFKELPKLSCDVQSMSQAFIHILRNAVQAVKDRGNIIIATEVNDIFIKISIKDDGVGINENIISKIFDPFFTTRDVGEGLGLGLYICHNIIEGHEGTINIFSKNNKGCTVNIMFPIPD